MTRMRSASVHDLIQLQGDQQDALAAVPVGDDLLVDVLDGTHVQTAGGLDGYQQLWVLVDLTGDDGLLLVAAGHTAGDGRQGLGRSGRHTAR